MYMLELYYLGLLQTVMECKSKPMAEYQGELWAKTPGNHYRIVHV